MKLYKIYFTYIITLPDESKRSIDITRIVRDSNYDDAVNQAYDAFVTESIKSNTNIQLITCTKVEEAKPRYGMYFYKCKGWDVLCYNGGSSDYIRWYDGKIYSINGEFWNSDFENKGKINGVRWYIRTDEYYSESNDACHIWLAFDIKEGKV